MARGWWTLKIEGVDDVSDATREHIADLITKGFTSGEVIEENDDDK